MGVVAGYVPGDVLRILWLHLAHPSCAVEASATEPKMGIALLANLHLPHHLLAGLLRLRRHPLPPRGRGFELGLTDPEWVSVNLVSKVPA